VFVGGQGNGAAGGFNGGGNAGPGGTRGGASYGGGGASDVRAGSDTLRDRILVAAGGGGEGSGGFEVGGRGGGEIGGIGGSYCYRGSSCIGGGGSSWAKSSVADFRTWAGWKNATGDGLVVFSW
jgi:hypothetical protein